MTRKAYLVCGQATCCARKSMNFFKLQFANLPHRKSKKAGTGSFPKSSEPLVDSAEEKSGAYEGRRISQSSSALKKRMAAAMTQATTAVRRELANSPILARSPVNWTSGITAKGN